MQNTEKDYYVGRDPKQGNYWCLFDGGEVILKDKDCTNMIVVCASMRHTICRRCTKRDCGKPPHLH